MDFFEHQEQARRRSGLLVTLFALAVICLVLGLNAAVGIALTQTGGRYTPGVAALVTAGTLLVIGGGTWARLVSLRGGGSVVAAGLGGHRVLADGASPQERQLLNVIGEIAIASGSPVPGVYVLRDEPGINAFAAGWSGSDAVIGVTQGCLEKLTRDELQGVIAHEFSHILQGDARLNIRLMGVIYGIVLLGIFGRILVHSLRFSGRSSNRKGNAVAVALAAGVTLMVLGYAGTFFGDLIKAAVSRQREFLADASAVQYTRNPSGIAGALMKIGGLREGSGVGHVGAVEASHMFFGAATAMRLRGLFATHPPLEERVLRLVPEYAGRLRKAFSGDRAAVGMLQAGAFGLDGGGVTSPAVAPAQGALAHIGAPTAAHLEQARSLLARLPADLRGAAESPFGARAIIHAMLIRPVHGVEGRSRGWLEHRVEPAVLREVDRWVGALGPLAPELRHAALDMALGSLEALSPEQGELLLKEIDGASAADGSVSVYESSVRRLVAQRLSPPAVDRRQGGARLADAKTHVRQLLWWLAHVGASDDAARERAFAVGWEVWGPGTTLPASFGVGGPVGGPVDLDNALERLAGLRPADRRRVLAAAAAIVEADGAVKPAEAELFRILAEALGAPVPPLSPGQRLVSGSAQRAGGPA